MAKVFLELINDEDRMNVPVTFFKGHQGGLAFMFFEQEVYGLMRAMTQGQYKGGYWDYYKAMIQREDEEPQVAGFFMLYSTTEEEAKEPVKMFCAENYTDLTSTYRACSFGANLVAVNRLAHAAHAEGLDALTDYFSTMYHNMKYCMDEMAFGDSEWLTKEEGLAVNRYID